MNSTSTPTIKDQKQQIYEILKQFPQLRLGKMKQQVGIADKTHIQQISKVNH